MAIPPPESLDWPADRAVLLVHGVGNARPGDYDDLVAQLRAVLGDDAGSFAIYAFYYDQVNEWFASKVQAARGVAAIAGAIRSRLDATRLGSVVADFAGDVVWPILLADAREAVRVALLRQIQQMVLDGKRARPGRRAVQPRDQHLSIIAHSMGCFHAFEALHTAARDRRQGIAPGTHGVVFSNVVLMASPVQLIRTVARELGDAVPQRGTLHCVAAHTLAMPAERIVTGDEIPSARRTVLITGDLDPIGGHFLRRRLDWAYTRFPERGAPEQLAFVDTQRPLSVDEDAGLVAVLERALQPHAPPVIAPENPHAWGGYVSRHATELATWLTA